jgi:bifunctional non-homologous end joining protein LigD
MLPAGFVVPAQPVERSRPPAGPDWVHEIKHDGYRMIVRRDGEQVRLFTRHGYDWTERYPAIAAAARFYASSFTIDGEAVVCGNDRLSRFDELRRRDAATKAILWAFDLIKHDGDDLRELAFIERKGRLARLIGRSNSAPRASCQNGSTRPTAQDRARPGSNDPVAVEAQRLRGENWNR